MATAEDVRQALRAEASADTAEKSQRFFKTGPGEYAEGDQFLGVSVPMQRRIARDFRGLPLAEIGHLLRDPVHECRLTGLILMVGKYRPADPEEKQALVDLYLSNLDHVNNWDLVDTSAPGILGEHLLQTEDRSILNELAASGDLWRQRTAVLATLTFIRAGRFAETLRLAEELLPHPHDLIHKAVGWMLREVGERDRAAEEAFLARHYPSMPRTMLRYAIEKFPPELRTAYLEGTVEQT